MGEFAEGGEPQSPGYRNAALERCTRPSRALFTDPATRIERLGYLVDVEPKYVVEKDHCELARRQHLKCGHEG